MIKNLSDDKLIRIANILDPHDDWQVSKKYAEKKNYLNNKLRIS